FVCRLLHLKIISLKNPLQIGLCNKAECNYSSFDNISISKNNFTLEYSTCADSSQIGYRYATFKTDKNKEPILIQDNYLVSPREETSDNFKPKKVNCLTSSKITFNQFNGRCG
ncbi:hypothetical protein, partial [Acinetobacter baumannii]|uniref:hypothetical protein n=1 Tax=Acinetobacter baumannii TaxID=470 RepID=UPI001D174146